MWITKQPDDHEYIQAQVLHINPAGSLVKVELERASGQVIQVEMPKSVLELVPLAKYDTVFVRPKHTKVFE
jgi:ABC-type sulfate/molybdate transport systems ATPase subunit